MCAEYLCDVSIYEKYVSSTLKQGNVVFQIYLMVTANGINMHGMRKRTKSMHFQTKTQTFLNDSNRNLCFRKLLSF